MLNGLWMVRALLTFDDGGDERPGLFHLRGQVLPIDGDNDGVFDYFDACPDTPIGVVVNDNGCSIEQLCPCDGPWKSRGHYLNTVLSVTKEFVADRLITPRERNAILAAAVKSPCGWRRRR
jgi:hypothetical protein